MPHDNTTGTIYSETVNGVKVGVNTDDIGAILGKSSHDVKTLAASDNVRPWSKIKPIIFDTPADLTDAQRKSANYGINVMQTTITNVNANAQRSWVYNQPQPSDGNYGRMTDFDGYDHRCTVPPLIFGFSFDEKTLMFNTVTTVMSSIAVKVSFRRNATTASNGIGVLGLSLDDLGETGSATTSLNSYVPCVTSYVNGTLYVANAEDTFGGKFSTGINDYAIIPANFGFMTNCWVDDKNGTGYPEDATEKYKMTLIPRINMFTPSTKGYVHTNLTNTANTNGHYLNATYPFVGVPDATPLVIRKYKRAPVGAAYSYFKDVSEVVTLAQGVYVGSNDAYTAQAASWGGKVVYFKDRKTIIEMMVELTNLETSAYSVQAVGITDVMNVWNKPCDISFKQADGTYKNQWAFTKNSSSWVTVRITYNAGCASSNYTFPAQTSPGYGQCQPKLQLRVIVANGTAEAFNPKEATQREVRWR